MAWSCEGGRSTVLRSGWTDEDHFVIGEGDAASFGGMLFYGLIAASFKKGLGGHRSAHFHLAGSAFQSIGDRGGDAKMKMIFVGEKHIEILSVRASEAHYPAA